MRCDGRKHFWLRLDIDVTFLGSLDTQRQNAVLPVVFFAVANVTAEAVHRLLHRSSHFRLAARVERTVFWLRACFARLASHTALASVGLPIRHPGGFSVRFVRSCPRAAIHSRRENECVRSADPSHRVAASVVTGQGVDSMRMVCQKRKKTFDSAPEVHQMSGIAVTMRFTRIGSQRERRRERTLRPRTQEHELDYMKLSRLSTRGGWGFPNLKSNS